MSHFKLLAFVTGLVLLISPFIVQAQTTTTTTVEKRVIVTPPPKGSCVTIPGRWIDDNTWAAEHTECSYENRTEGVTWISDYWSCTAATADGTCTSWVLVPGHWQTT